MNISKTICGTTCQFALAGQFTLQDHILFKDILHSMSHPEICTIELEISKLTFMDSAALGMLLMGKEEARKYQKSLVVQNPTGQVKKLFDVARVDTLLTVR